MHKRRCVKCGADFHSSVVGEVEVDVCRSCGGLWLDADELQQLAEMPDQTLDGLRELVWQEPEGTGGAALASTPTEDAVAERHRLESPCPACEGKLTSAVVGTVNLEVCCRCGGVFLDPGELDPATAEVRSREEKLATIAAMARSITTRGTIGD